MHQLSRIDAVNQIMKIKSGERISTEGELSTLPQAVEAGVELDYAVTEIMVQNKWFITDVDHASAVTNNDGELITPDNLGFITVERTDAAVSARHLIPINGKLYDKYNHTYNLGVGKTVWYNGKLVWSFEELPAVFQVLCIAKTRLNICTRGASFSPQRAQAESIHFQKAWNAAIMFDSTLSGGRVTGWSSNRNRAPRNRGVI